MCGEILLSQEITHQRWKRRSLPFHPAAPLVLGGVTNKPEKIQQYWGLLGTNIPKYLNHRGLEKAQRY